MASFSLDKAVVTTTPKAHWQESVSLISDANAASDDEIKARIEEYVNQCNKLGSRPLVTGLALAAGFNGPTEMRRIAMRRPSLLPIISRALTLVASYYEEMIGRIGGNGPLFMLKNIPDFDSTESTKTPTYTFKESVTVDTNIQGVIRHEHTGQGLSPREAYLALIRGVTIENAEYTVETEEKPAPSGPLARVTSIVPASSPFAKYQTDVSSND